MLPHPVRISKQPSSHMRGILDAGLSNVVRTRWTVGLREGAGEWFAGLGLGCRLGFFTTDMCFFLSEFLHTVRLQHAPNLILIIKTVTLNPKPKTSQSLSAQKL